MERALTRTTSFSCVALLLSALALPAQQPSQSTAATAALPSYDVVAIHENRSGSSNSSAHWGDDAYIAENTTLTFLLTNAYGIRQELMSGLPSWANSVHFNINAKISDPDIDAIKKLSREQRNAMIAELLKERFHLRAHIEPKTLPVYDLVIAKGGPKLKQNNTPLPTSFDAGKTQSGPPPGSISGTDTGVTAVAVPISMFAENLAFRLQRNVIDKTGLTGRYDIDLKWTPVELDGKTGGITDNVAPNLFTALQEQLGLKLEPSKGPVDALVIDHVEMPTEN